ncbi:RIP metalloprotease RseP [Desulfitobacterium metallireducens]|uniref:Zinc metalloprotease n=1 Tax=Desulfitobacterium metallireducens DSM 15288 TaxID=871968 RepID=W0EE84_9FIRM|nr:RIP metalloprotease RseP [Desulfitobacterium metallireducens]AHF07524.1 RIP metalloprotease RseP [Desulfitobacterium metallireducens DSM 15288]
MTNALAVIFVFGLLVMIHEFGHYIVARLNGIKVLEFAFGFGPKIVGYKGKETEYNLRVIPLGGFVRLYGMDPEVNENGEQELAPSHDPRSFTNKKVWQRMAVIAAGAIMNFVLAIFLFVLVFAYYGIPTAANGNAIGSIVEGKSAAQAGIQAGAKILAIDGIATPEWDDCVNAIHSKPNQKVTLTLEQAGKQETVTLQTEKDEQTGFGMVGIAPQVIYEKTSLVDSVKYGWQQTVDLTKLIVVSLTQMITGKTSAELGGPVAIAQVIGEGAKQGFANLLSLTGMLSVQLGLLNLFPIPALDGSRLVFLLIEGLRGKPINPERENFIHFIGFVLLFALMIAVTYQDILKLFVGKG